MKTLEQTRKYRIEYLTCKNEWRDMYGRLLTKNEVNQLWNIAYSNFTHVPGRRTIRLVDENGRDMDA